MFGSACQLDTASLISSCILYAFVLGEEKVLLIFEKTIFIQLLNPDCHLSIYLIPFYSTIDVNKVLIP